MEELIARLRSEAGTSAIPALGELLDAVDAIYGRWAEWDDLFGAVTRARQAVEHLEREAVRMARLEGESWNAIGDWLGITGPGARKRYVASGRTDLRDLDRLDEIHAAELEAFHSDFRLAVARRKAGAAPSEPSDEDARAYVFRELGFGQRLLGLIDAHTKQRRDLAAQLT